MVSKTTIKSSAMAHTKRRRFLDRQDRSICVQMKKRIKLDVDLDKSQMENVIKGIHSGIEDVHFPRQRVPRFFFVVCKDDKIKKEVSTAIHVSNIAELGPLFPKRVIEKEFIVKEPIEASGKKAVDPLTLVLEAIPKSLETEAIKKEFPKCKDTIRFNNSRCYVSFSNIPDAYEALKRIKGEPLCGFKITARFNRVVKEKQMKTDKAKTNRKTFPNNNRKTPRAKDIKKTMQPVGDDEESS